MTAATTPAAIVPAPAPVAAAQRPSPMPAPRVAVARPVPPAASAPEARVYASAELPEAIRRQLPTLTVGGSIYSDNAASRFLIINGQIFHEKDKIAPDLFLEQIKLKAAVLSYKGYRYGISF